MTERRVALITGASRGIGRATAIMAAKRGWDICLNYARDTKAAEATAETCRNVGAKVVLAQADVADRAAVRAMFETSDDAFGRLDLLVNNAGIVGGATRFTDLSEDTLRRTIDVNLAGTIWCAQEAALRMARARGGTGGAIVNLSSIAAVGGSPGEYVHYAATKGAVETLTIGLARELGGEGIRVTAIRAGTTDTEIHARDGNPDRPAAIARATPSGRIAQPEDIAAAILWLGSDAASHISGAIVPVTGGL